MPSAENNAQLALTLVALRQALDTPPHPAQPALPRWSIGKKVGSDFHQVMHCLAATRKHVNHNVHTHTQTHANLIAQRVH